MLFPLAVYFGINYLEPWKLAGILIVLLVIKLATGYSDNRWNRPLLVAGVLYCGFALWSNNLDSLSLDGNFIGRGICSQDENPETCPVN